MCQAASDPIQGLAGLSLRDAMTYVKTEFGTPSQATLDQWMLSTEKGIDNPAEFAREMNLRIATYACLAAGGQSIPQTTKIQQVVKSVAGNAILTEMVKDWCRVNGNVQTRTLETLVTAVKAGIRSYTSAEAGYAGSATSAPPTYTQAEVNAMLTDAVANGGVS